MPTPSAKGPVLIATLVTAVVLLAAFGLAWLGGAIHLGQEGAVSDATSSEVEGKGETDRKYNIICEVKYTLPLNGIAAPPKVYTDTMVGGLDYAEKTGWYQGQFSISENRKGNLVVREGKTEVSRPAMFERFGEKVASEQFSLDRTTGEFTQALLLQDGRRLEVIKGYCGKLTPPPF